MNPEAYLQYGALGLLGIVFVGVMWYVRNVETRQAARDALESEERRQFVTTLLELNKALATLNEKIEAQEKRATERHKELRGYLRQGVQAAE